MSYTYYKWANTTDKNVFGVIKCEEDWVEKKEKNKRKY